MQNPRLTAGRLRVSQDHALIGVFTDESEPTTLDQALPEGLIAFDRVRYLFVPPSWCTVYRVKCYRWSEALDTWFEDPDAGGTFSANAIVVQDVMGDRLAMIVTDIGDDGTKPSAPSDGTSYDAEDYINRAVRGYLVGA